MRRKTIFGTAVALVASVAFAAPDDYLVVDFAGGVAAERWTVREAAKLAVVSNDQCRTRELWLRLIPLSPEAIASRNLDLREGRDFLF